MSLPRNIVPRAPSTSLKALRSYSSQASTTSQESSTSETPLKAPKRSKAPRPVRHLTSIADLNHNELYRLVSNAHTYKLALNGKLKCLPPKILDGKQHELKESLARQTIAMMFSKRSTRTRVSTEAAVVAMGGHPMFLGKEDIQLGVNETILDSAKVISSMTSGLVARVGDHSEIEQLALHSSVPVINALSNDFHPLQTIADFLTIREEFKRYKSGEMAGLKLAWVGDANNVLYDLAIGAMKLGVEISVATPEGYSIPERMMKLIEAQKEGVPWPGSITTTNVPEEAVKNADVIVTDTWVSMGQEEETARRLKAFEGFQVTMDLAKRGGAKEDWKFMHCLPRHAEEVSDEVFYSPRSLVFPEAENRLYAAITALEAFVVSKGRISDLRLPKA